MNVAYVTMGFPTRAETFACTDIRALRRAGVDVTIYSMRTVPRDRQALLSQRGLSGLRVDYASASGLFRGLWHALVHLPLALSTCAWIVASTWRHPKFLGVSLALVPRSFEIVMRLEADPPDVVHLFWGHYPSIVGYLMRRRMPDCVLSMFLGAYDLVYRYRPSARLAREADVVWTHAHDNVRDLEQLGVARERISVVHRGVDLDWFEATGAKVARRIVCAARLCADKHVDHVLEAFASVVRRHPEASLVIMGEGPEREALERLACELHVKDAVRFTGHVPHRVVRDEMAAAEVFVLMSQEDTERLTNSIKEAMACECVCVVTRSPGIEELITNGVHGFIVEQGDVEGAALAVDWTLRNPEDAAVIRRNAVDRIRAAFDVRSAMKVYEQRWRVLASTAGGTPIVGAASPSNSSTV